MSPLNFNKLNTNLMEKDKEFIVLKDEPFALRDNLLHLKSYSVRKSDQEAKNSVNTDFSESNMQIKSGTKVLDQQLPLNACSPGTYWMKSP